MAELLQGWKRSGYCTDYNKADAGKEVVLMGWVQRRRNLGGLIFVWLRDRSGIMQLTFDETKDSELFTRAEALRSEWVVAIKGIIEMRTPENINPELPTGEIEIDVKQLKILSEAQTPPFEIEDRIKVGEELRLKYRYLDLRRPEMQRNLAMRNKVTTSVREYLSSNDFWEIETPFLQKSTPEGARDYLVPSRLHHGSFYALPQSPQIFKQLLMVSGMDRYYQFARCFRDEDLRADRQPEFTQIDMELSFVEAEDVMAVNEGLLKKLFKDTLDIDIKTPIRRMTYAEAMRRYGSDKPDLRFGLELNDISAVVSKCGFKVFSGAVKNGGSVRGINAKGASKKLSRKEIDALGELVKGYGAKGLAWINLKDDGIVSPIAKFLTEDELNAVTKEMGAETGDILLFVADTDKTVFASLGALRLKLASMLELQASEEFALCWVTEFPLFEYSEEEGRLVAMHHPFTSPMDEDIELLEAAPEKARAKAYDIVLNGNEIGGGSIRIHSTELQEKMFRALGFTKEAAWERFGFMMEAFKYGTPPHGGLAFGLDRVAMLLAGRTSIRDVIAFPKVQNASCLMSGAPDVVELNQLTDLGLAVSDKEQK